MTADDVEKLPWKRHPKQNAVETLDVGPLRLSVTDSKWWCMGHMKAVECKSRGGAKLKSVLWVREQAAAIARDLAALGGAA